jgi:hypothetical protein
VDKRFKPALPLCVRQGEEGGIISSRFRPVIKHTYRESRQGVIHSQETTFNQEGGKTMARYILFWEVDTTRTPADPKEKQQQWLGLHAEMEKLLKSGEVTEFANYVGEAAGYCIVDGTEMDVEKIFNIYAPFVKFECKQVISAEQDREGIKAMKV